MRTLLTTSLLLLLLGSCTQYAYYQSPLQANTNPYRTLPRISEDQPSAIYASGSYTIGSANDDARDQVKAFSGSVYRAHQFNWFQAYYGANGHLGYYKVGQITGLDPYFHTNQNMNDSLINTMRGKKSFGSWGAIGGVNLVMPLSNRSEWRMIGTDLSWNKEFGHYLDFRNKLPDTAANYIERNDQFFTISLYTDLVLAAKKGTFGMKWAMVYHPRSLDGFDTKRKPMTLHPNYFAFTLHYTNNRITGFWQANISPYANSVQLGANIRLSKLSTLIPLRQQPYEPSSLPGTRRRSSVYR
ncbi:MAG: hypothetical protein P0Y53_15960 [Candidatus Pseudobacter hemicellulosilyticus]|uniref:Uncharacterized protein n=1 Tax=Candidatus Pseudobacter hemicellulosilyticus TaxID=3121375 RepID=A0AAJ5WP47_9BACT|nr:MAG: hypothetical protein P0Y53_15960 [Pseudobacter sp.]